MCKCILIDSCGDCPYRIDNSITFPTYCKLTDNELNSNDPDANNCPLSHPYDLGLDWSASDDI